MNTIPKTVIQNCSGWEGHIGRFDPAFRVDPNAEIVNLGGYSMQLVNQLRSALAEEPCAREALVHADPNRDGFYDVECSGRVFFIHVSPLNHKVLLLATWAKQDPRCLDHAAD